MVIKKYILIGSFICCQLLFILLHIDKQNRFIHYTYKRQRMEQALQETAQELHAIERRLFERTDLGHIKEYAQRTLQMNNAKLKQFKSIEEGTL